MQGALLPSPPPASGLREGRNHVSLFTLRTPASTPPQTQHTINSLNKRKGAATDSDTAEVILRASSKILTVTIPKQDEMPLPLTC